MSEKLNERNKQKERLQQNLSSIRKIAGWTAEVLGEKIGVTKQTISNIENNKSAMSFSQYIAIRSVLDAEIASNNENELLLKVVAILLDSEDEISEDEYSQIQDVVETVAATAAGGTPKGKLDTVFDILIKSIPFVIPVIGAIIVSANWKNILK